MGDLLFEYLVVCREIIKEKKELDSEDVGRCKELKDLILLYKTVDIVE